MSRGMQMARWNSRLRDIAESQSLLLELATSEPTLNQCFKVIESTCLSQGIHCRVDGAEVSEAFQRHLDEFYVPFCKAAIRAFFTYGFVPWRARRISRGDEVPEVIPCGTFSWHTELGPVEQGRVPARYGDRRPVKMRYSDDDTRMVVYRVTPTSGGWKEADIQLYVFQPPALDISMNSLLAATVPSPLSHILVDYKNLRQAQIRRSNADAWNTTAKIISTFEPKLRVEDNPRRAPAPRPPPRRTARTTPGERPPPRRATLTVPAAASTSWTSRRRASTSRPRWARASSRPSRRTTCGSGRP